MKTTMSWCYNSSQFCCFRSADKGRHRCHGTGRERRP